MRSLQFNTVINHKGPGSIRLCPGQSLTDVDGGISTVMKAHRASITAFIHMAGRNRGEDFLDLCSDNNLLMTSPIESTLRRKDGDSVRHSPGGREAERRGNKAPHDEGSGAFRFMEDRTIQS